MKILNQALSKNILGYLLSGLIRVISVLIGFFLTLAISNKLNPSDAGYFFLILSIITITSFILTFGREYKVLKEIAINRSQNALANDFIYISKEVFPLIFIGLFLCLIFQYVSINIGSAKTIDFLRSAIYSIPALTGIIIISFAIQGQSRISLSILTSRILCPLFLIIVLYFNFFSDIEDILSSYVFLAWICFFVSLVLFFFYEKEDYSKKPSDHLKDRKTKQKIYLFLIGVCQQIFIWQGTILTSIFFQYDDISVIVITQRTALIISFVLITINAVNAPKFARLYAQDDIAGIKDLALSSTILSISFGLITAFLMFIFSENIILLFGESYLDGIPKLKILIIGQIFLCCAGPVGVILLMSNRYKQSAFSSIFSLLLSLLFAYFFSQDIGLNSVPISIVLSLFIKSCMDLYFARKILF